MKSCILTIRIDVTSQLPATWEAMEDRDIVEYFSDTPELIVPAIEENGVVEIGKVERGVK